MTLEEKLDGLQAIVDLKVQHEKEYTLAFLREQAALMMERFKEGTAEKCLWAKAEVVNQMADAIRANKHRPKTENKP